MKRAILDFDEAIRLDPEVALNYVKRARALATLDYEHQAKEDTERAVKLGFDPAKLNDDIVDLYREAS